MLGLRDHMGERDTEDMAWSGLGTRERKPSDKPVLSTDQGQMLGTLRGRPGRPALTGTSV